MEIEITITENGEEIIQRTICDFEDAEETLGKLERQYYKRDADLAAINEENN